MGKLVTEGYVEVSMIGAWIRPPGSPHSDVVSIPRALELGRGQRKYELDMSMGPDAPAARAVRVVDAAGVVVAQWGKP